LQAMPPHLFQSTPAASTGTARGSGDRRVVESTDTTRSIMGPRGLAKTGDMRGTRSPTEAGGMRGTRGPAKAGGMASAIGRKWRKGWT